MSKVTTSPILPLKAGNAIAFAFNDDGTLDRKSADKAVTNPGTVESIGRTNTTETKEYPDGNSRYPMTIRTLKINDRFRVNFSSFQPQLYALVTGESIEEKQNVTMSIVEAKKTIDDTNYTIKLDPPYDGEGMLFVTGVDSTQFTKAETSPQGTGEFSVSADTLTFSSADAGKEVFLSYDYTATEAIESAATTTQKRPEVHLIIGSEVASQPGDKNVYRSNTVIDKCVAVGDVNTPEQKPDTDGWSVEFQVLEPRGGQKPVRTLYDKTPVNTATTT